MTWITAGMPQHAQSFWLFPLGGDAEGRRLQVEGLNERLTDARDAAAHREKVRVDD